MPHFFYRDFLVEILTLASDIALQRFENVTGRTKPDDSSQVVTDADLEIGNLISERITRYYPQDSIIDEESGVVRNSASRIWVVDPIDGTSNFAAGVPLFGVMVGFLNDSVPLAGGIALPPFASICVAEKGCGAWCGDKPIAVSSNADLKTSLIAYGIDRDPANREATNQEGQFLADLVSRIRNLRSSNSAFDVVMVAQGKYGALLTRRSRLWDNVAPHVLIEEAGGRYTTFDGKPIQYADPIAKVTANFTVCAGAPMLHHELQALIRPSYK